MKRFFTLILSVSFAGSAFAQLSSVNPPTVVYGGFNDTGLSAHFDIENMGASPLDVHVAREEIALVGTAQSSFCWGPNCFPPSVSATTTPTTIAGGATENTFRGYYHPAGNAGVGTVKWTFFVDGDSANTAMPITIDYDASFAESINDFAIPTKLENAYPNPADKTTAISYSHNGQKAAIVIYDMLGSEVYRFGLEARQGVTILNTSELKGGVYFYTIEVDNSIKATKKLVVAHK